jgi:methyltransferase
VSNRNEKKLGTPKEVGVGQRKVMVALHTSWFLAMLIEYNVTGTQINPFFNLIILVLLVSAYLRYLSMQLLKEQWSTKVLILDKQVIKTHIYKYFNNPNYLAVIIEVALIPLLFNLYYTSLIFSFLNVILLILRISLEKKVLEQRLNI